MKKTLNLLLGLSLATLLGGCGSEATPPKAEILKASCGMCQLNQRDQRGCIINVVHKGEVLPLVGGPKLTMEEMHAPGGFCVTIRKAKVIGKVKDDRFIASSWELLPIDENTPSLPAGH